MFGSQGRQESFLTLWFCMFRSSYTNIIGLRISSLKVNTLLVTPLIQTYMYCYLSK